jgi:hypothetical protein
MTVLHAQDSLRLLPTDEKWEIVRRYKPEDFGGPNDAHESLFGRDLLSYYTLTFKQTTELTLERR